MTKFLLVLSTLALALGTAPAADSSRPYIVFILADDLGYADLGCYGAAKIKTPHLDRLAGQGALFTSFYANATVCSPTREAHNVAAEHPEIVERLRASLENTGATLTRESRAK